MSNTLAYGELECTCLRYPCFKVCQDLSFLSNMPRILSRLLHQTLTNQQHTHTNVEISKGLGKLSVLPRELRHEIYSYLFPVRYDTLWCAHFNGKAPVFSKPNHLKAAWSKVPGSSIAILQVSHIIHDEAKIISYSRGIFHFSSPYSNTSASSNARMTRRIMDAIGSSLPLRRHRIGAFPGSNITSRIMNVELYYDLDMDLFLDSSTTTTPTPNPTNSIYSNKVDPIALFSGSNIPRNSCIIYFRMAEQSRYPLETIPPPLLNVIKQLTGFRDLTVKVCIWIDTIDG